MCEDVNEATVNAAVAGDEAVAGGALLFHAEIGAMMADKFVELIERALVEEEFDALAGAELAFFVLALAPFGAAAGFGFRGAPAELFEGVAIFGRGGHRDSALER